MIALNHSLAFALEAALIVAVARFAFGVGSASVVQWLLALVSAAAVIALWGRFAAPRARHRLGGARLFLFKAALFATGALALAGTGWPIVALVFLLLAAAHLLLASRLGVL